MSRIKPETYGYGAGRNRSSVWARWVIGAACLVLVSIALSGCSSKEDTARAMKAYIEACKGPVSSTLTLGNWGSDLRLSCPDFKPSAKESP